MEARAMQYMLLIYLAERALDETERQECYRDSIQLAHELRSAGRYLDAAPLHSTSMAASVRVREGRRFVTDGPFAETREQLGGYFMIEAKDLDEAVTVAARIPMARKGTIEVRPVIEVPGLPVSAAGAIPGPGTASADLVLTRVLGAPGATVFKAWTDPRRFAQWWGPHGFTNPVCELDVRPGGAMRVHMRAPDGTVYPMTGTYREVVEPDRLVFTSAALDAEGTPLFEVSNAVTLVEGGGQTTLTLRVRVVEATPAAAPYLSGMEAGWRETLERLAAHVTA
jgi:uncharacterized protein YndB with AHSA1/START domain